MSIQAVEHVYPTPLKKALISGSVMMATTMVALDITIANVALPHMQSSLGASPEQVMWVLTSYLIASAIMTPLSSWLASRYGRRLVMTVSATGFTLASMACGLATSLEMMVIARLLQGMSGAGLVPLSQATLLDINPPHKQAQAMALIGMGSMLGPLAGPTLGGWLTDTLSWRWVFLINIPFGIMAIVGLATSLQETKVAGLARFDLFGFASLAIFLGAFQLLLDRGPHLDWFDSTEVWIEATVMGLAGWFAVVHMFTARNSFIRVEIFRDRNFAAGCVLSSKIGVIAFATVPVITVMMQSLLGYTPYHTGLVSFPRGAGTVLALLVVGRLVGRIDARLLLFSGLALTAFSLYLFSRLSLQTDETPLLIAGFLQGLSGGLMIAPLTALTYQTLTPDYRNEGAAINSLVRNIGSSLGISGLQVLATQNAAAVSSRLAEGVRPDNPVLQAGMPEFSFDAAEAVAMISGQISRQAAMVAAVDSMWLTCVLAVAVMPVVFLMRGQQRTAAVPADQKTGSYPGGSSPASSPG